MNPLDEKKRNASTKAKEKYNAANYDQVKLMVKKGDRERIDREAALHGMSRNAFILAAIEEKIERAKKEQEE
ncbi:transcriptional regulator [Paenibacillus sp. UNC451MF]|uniref:transcriptional regulator n=1 Tax=Paenibacillus sp. UNC451MF TaxID=1449063 RepID=UPI001E65DFE5|nr:transcriptional regulator [Paenibacillus sp. UNC451MF]